MEKWLSETLSKCLDCVVTDKMMATILAIQDDRAFDDYFGNLLCEEDEEHRMFLQNCRRMLLSGKQPRSQNFKKKSPPIGGESASAGGAGKKQGKSVNLYGGDGKMMGDQILLKGRRICNCQAAQHKLINNCLRCGRIVCEQEGSGPCLYCTQPVYTDEEEQLMAKAAALSLADASTKGQTKAQKKQQKQKQLSEKSRKDSDKLQEALAQRDRLLEYDRNSEKRTTVIDDELDYFQENSVWLTDTERAKYEQLKSEMHEMKHGSRLKRKIKVDFAGRELPDEPPVTREYEEKVLGQLAAVTKATAASTLIGHSSMGLAPNLDVAKPPIFKASEKQATSASIHDGLERIYNRVQDKELLEMQDMRQCLSMHQPWASLLVAGLKKHEGRVWYTEHRGRLWIASTAKEPHADDIAQMEDFYRSLYNDKDLKFPTHYPTGSLLGCVHVEHCLPQEEYRDMYPQDELPLKTHNAACKTLLRARANKG
ncbi:activating signal cointegrator 1 isoform X2 [Drosophila grimshawi]|uniref:activating signal cointegrator 1 isoform X2 n=1 Tax=Drosophila grimshawi TaxID=7222 RepID=UPI000C86EDB4|nr:activating signal cointegrator 1 isoform X2 [Drosophila grimshawi]